MKTELSFTGARGVDSWPFSHSGTTAQAKSLKEAGAEFFVGYLGVINRPRLDFLLDAGLAFMPVTLANRFDGAQAVRQCKDLGLTPGCTVWLDVEGKTIYDMPAKDLVAKINAWAAAMKSAGYQPGIYVGSPQPLTSEELWKLGVVRYWEAGSREVDRFGRLAEPKCGWCMSQFSPSVWYGGVWVDMNMIGQDFLQRLPSWVRK